MERLYKKYLTEKVNSKGQLVDVSYNVPNDFNFAFDVVDALAKKSPNKLCMKWISKDFEERNFTFADISENSSRIANFLVSLGINKGDKVMIVLKRHHYFWSVIIALHKIGAVAIPATHQLMKKDFVYRFESAKVSAIITLNDDNVTSEINQALNQCPFVKHRISIKEKIDGYLRLEDEMPKFSDEYVQDLAHKTNIDDPMLMYFTSGTTGYPKIATHTFGYPIGHIVTAVWWHDVKEDGLHFTIADTGWGKAVWGKLYGQWLAESAIFTYDFDRFHADVILSMFAKHKITTFCAPPTMYRFFIKENLCNYDLSSLLHCTIAGEALNPEVFKQWKTATGLSLMEGFGQTETTLTVANLKNTLPKPGSMGKPNPQYKVEVVDENNCKVKKGVVGEIVVRTDVLNTFGLFSGYYLNKEKTDEVWSNNVYHTGDTAWEDEDGYLWYVGRADDIIKSSGYRIGPFEIESVLMEHPAVKECAVTGVPDSVRGQAIKATIVLSNGFLPSDELAKEIQMFVKNATAPYKYPRVVQFIDEMPKTISGKIKRIDIRDAKV